MTGNKKFLTLATTLIASVSLGVGVIVINGVNSNASLFAKADLSYSVNFNSSNGAVSSEGQVLKTRSVVAKTNLNNDVSVYFKNAQNTAGKVGTIKAKGFYGNKNPIYDMVNIRVTSNATESGDATLYYGPTSSYMPNSVALSAAASGVDVSGKSANYFKIVANKDVVVESIEINFGCATKDFGPIAYNADNPYQGYDFKFVDGAYHVVINKSNRQSMVKAMIPDYYDDGVNGEHPVVQMPADSGWGVFEGSTLLEEVYIPETITLFGNYLFNATSKVTEFTLPYALTSTGSYMLPKDKLEVLNIHSVNLATVSTKGVSTTNTPNLREVNISYDVEKLPDIVDSWPNGVVINYEGTEAEWATLTGVTGTSTKWTTGFSGDVICSDTEVATVTFSYAGGTLDTVQNEMVMTKVVGKTIANPGSPTYDDGTKQFKGWFDAATGGNAIIFPMTVTGDTTIYAHFEEYGAGISFSSPVEVTMGQTYNYSTDSTYTKAYFKVTADHDMVFRAVITSAANAFGGYIYMKTFNEDESARAIETGNSAAAESHATSMSSTYGTDVPLKVRLSDGDSVFVVVDGNDNASRIGDFTISFTECDGTDGTDYTTAIPYVIGQNTQTAGLPRYGCVWYSFTPATSGTYMYKATATAWTGADLAYFNAGVYTSLKTSGSEMNLSSGSTNRKLYNLTAGVTYYVSFNVNTAGTTATFMFTDEIDAGLAKSSAIAVTVDGSAVVVPYDSNFPSVFYKFAVENGKEYRLVVDNDTTIYTSGSSRPLFAVTNEADNEVTINAGRTAHDKKVTAAADGFLYVCITTSSTAKNFEFSVQSVGEEVTVNVYANGPTAAMTSTETIDAGSAYNLPNPTYSSNGHTYYTGFEGWFTDAECTVPFTSGSTINANTNIYAKLTGKYTSDVLNAIDDGDTNDVINSMDNYGTSYPMYLDGADFVSSNEAKASSYSGIKIEVKKNCQVSFDYTIDSERNSDKIKVDVRATSGSSTVNKLSDSSDTSGEPKNGSFQYTLETGNVIEIYYYKDSSIDKGTDKLVIKNFTFSTVSNYTLSYNFGDERPNQEVEVISGAAITKIADPTREGYRFDGWYTTDTFETPFNFANGITADTEIFAKWVETVTVTIYADGPDAASTETRVIDKGSQITLSNLNNSYYTGFEGWFTDPELTQPIASGDTVNSSISVYAKHSGKYRMDVFNDIDSEFADIFSDISGTNNSYHWNFDKVNGKLTSGNKGAGGATSTLVLVLKEKTTVSFDYKISSESGWDKCTIKYEYNSVTTKVVDDGSGEVSGTFSETLEAGTIITITYTKDGSGNSGDDMVTLSNLSFIKFVA